MHFFCDRASWNARAQCKERGSISGHPSAQSSSTELRTSHSTLRNALHMWWSALQGASKTLPVCSTAASTQVYRPTVLVLFFPRVRTPCGHGAQVIVEGREEQSDGGEKNKETQHNPKQTTQSPQAESPPSCSLSSVLGETGETKTSV